MAHHSGCRNPGSSPEGPRTRTSAGQGTGIGGWGRRCSAADITRLWRALEGGRRRSSAVSPPKNCRGRRWRPSQPRSGRGALSAAGRRGRAGRGGAGGTEQGGAAQCGARRHPPAGRRGCRSRDPPCPRHATSPAPTSSCAGQGGLGRLGSRQAAQHGACRRLQAAQHKAGGARGRQLSTGRASRRLQAGRQQAALRPRCLGRGGHRLTLPPTPLPSSRWCRQRGPAASHPTSTAGRQAGRQSGMGQSLLVALALAYAGRQAPPPGLPPLAPPSNTPSQRWGRRRPCTAAGPPPLWTPRRDTPGSSPRQSCQSPCSVSSSSGSGSGRLGRAGGQQMPGTGEGASPSAGRTELVACRCTRGPGGDHPLSPPPPLPARPPCPPHPAA